MFLFCEIYTMKNLLDSFIEERRTQNIGRNRLIPFKAEIEYLREKGMGYQDIVAFLKSQNVEVSPQAVGYFCRTHLERQKRGNVQAIDIKPQHTEVPKLTVLQKHQQRLAESNAKNQETGQPNHEQKERKISSTGYLPPSWNADFDLDAALGIKTDDNDN